MVSCICCAETRGKDGLAGDGPGGITHCIFKRMFFKSKACMEPPPFLFSGAIKGWGERQKEDELERYGDEETQRERDIKRVRDRDTEKKTWAQKNGRGETCTHRKRDQDTRKKQREVEDHVGKKHKMRHTDGERTNRNRGGGDEEEGKKREKREGK